jgi:hypothetical protein
VRSSLSAIPKLALSLLLGAWLLGGSPGLHSQEQDSAIATMMERSSAAGVFHVEDFPVAGGKFMGNWNNGTAYPLCSTVSYQGADWIATANRSTGDPHQYASGMPIPWVKFNSTGANLAATQADCAFFTAYAYVQSRATSYSIPASADLEFQSPMRGYDKNGDWVMPSNKFGYSISLHGRGRSTTTINQAVSTMGYMVTQEPLGDAKIVSQEIIGIQFNANLLAGGCLSLHGVRRSHYREITCFNPQQQKGGSIQYAMWIGNKGDSYEVSFEQGLVRSPTYPGLAIALAEGIVSNGEITGYRISVKGAKLNLPIGAGPGLVTYWLGKGPGDRSFQPCKTMPDQPTYSIDPSSGQLLDIKPGSNKGSGCGGTVYVRVQEAGTIPYAWFFGSTDSTFKDIVTSGDYTKACQFDVHGANHFIHEHPYCFAPVQIQTDGSNWHDATQLDSPIRYGMVLQGPGDIFTSYMAQWNNTNYAGASEVLIEPGATFNTISASNCGGIKQSKGGYAKFTSTTAGPLSNTSKDFPNGFTIQGAEPNCDGSNTNWGDVIPGLSPSH